MLFEFLSNDAGRGDQLKRRDWPTPQSFCRNTIVDFGQTCVCALVYSLEVAYARTERGCADEEAGNCGSSLYSVTFQTYKKVASLAVATLRPDFPSGAIQRGTNFFF